MTAKAAVAATRAEVLEWQKTGGTVTQERKGGGKINQTFTSSSGEKFSSWKDAKAFLAQNPAVDQENKPMAEAAKPANKKRGKDSAENVTDPSVAKKPKVALVAKDSNVKPASSKAKPAAEVPEVPAKGKKAAAPPKAAQSELPAKGKKAPVLAKSAKGATPPVRAPTTKKALGTSALSKAATKTKGSRASKAPTPKDKASDAEEDQEDGTAPSEDSDSEDEADVGNPAAASDGIVRRQATLGIGSYKEPSDLRIRSFEKVKVKLEKEVDSEQDAWDLTGPSKTNTRRLHEFAVVDAGDDHISLEQAALQPGTARLKAIVLPADGPVSKDLGARVTSPFGPITSWAAAYTKAGWSLTLKTDVGAYALLKPAAGYRKTHQLFTEQLDLAHQVYVMLSPRAGGNLTVTLDEVVAGLGRQQLGKSYGSAREALLLNAQFLSDQLVVMGQGDAAVDSTIGKEDYVRSTFGTALAAEGAERLAECGAPTNAVSIRIRDPSAAPDPAQPDADPSIARDAEVAARLQAQLDCEASRGGGGGGGRSQQGGSAAPILISERVIAQHYPPPKMYEKVIDEMDELMMADEEVLAGHWSPEIDQAQLLDNFAFYDAQGHMTTLELLPIHQGFDSNVFIFGSGDVSDGSTHMDTADPGAGSGSGSAAGGSSAAPAPEAEAAAPETGAGAADAAPAATPAPAFGAPGSSGLRVLLSQIREWCVEASADDIYIYIRTDASWYKLARPLEEYLPWYKVVTKVARLAVFIFTLLDGEVRAARLSFNECIRKVAELSNTHPAYVSNKVDVVQRFVVIHGQVILNQFKMHYNKTLKNSGFVLDLQQHMMKLEHVVLHKARPNARKQPRADNPMQSAGTRAPRAKPMPATATRMVKCIWQSYFSAAEPEEGTKQEVEEQEQDVPKVVEGEEEDEDELVDKEAEETNKKASGAGGGGGTAADVEPDSSGDAGKEVTSPRAGKAGGGGGMTTPRAKRQVKKEAVRKAKVLPPLDVKWKGKALRTDEAGRVLYKQAVVGGQVISLGDTIALREVEYEDPTSRPAEVDSSPASSPAASPAASPARKKKKGGRKAEVKSAKKLAKAAKAAAAQQEEQQAKAEAAKEEVAVDWKLLYGQDSLCSLGYVKCLFEDEEGNKRAQVLCMKHGCQTVLQDAATIGDLFITPDHQEWELSDVKGTLKVETLDRPWTPAQRQEYFKEDAQRWEANKAALEAGSPLTYVILAQYRPLEGMFRSIPPTALVAEGDYTPAAVGPVKLGVLPKAAGFIKDGVEYRLGDFMFINPMAFDDTSKPNKGTGAASTSMSQPTGSETGGRAAKRGSTHKGSNEGRRAFGVAQLVQVHTADEGGKTKSKAKGQTKLPSKLVVRRLYRPEDISPDVAYTADWTHLYAGTQDEAGQEELEVAMVASKLTVHIKGQEPPAVEPGIKHVFQVVGSYDPASPGEILPPPDSLDLKQRGSGKGSKKSSAGGGSAEAAPAVSVPQPEPRSQTSAVELASLDIFAGCGGLSAGMHKAGVSKARWGIEYDTAAAAAFQLNNPEAKVFANNCNVLLQAAMEKAGVGDDCTSCADCDAACKALPADQVAGLPVPGEVEFIMGGPPCQGYSGMNRFNKGNWSMVQNSMVMAYLSYAEFYRPRFFLLENVRNFVSHNKGFTFRLVINTLLQMGYQVRFGVLNAGYYGVPQSRSRTIIWAAAPGEELPDWPEPLHVFRSAQLGIKLGDGTTYCAVPDLPGGGAPYRAITVKDAIWDLPAIENGEAKAEREYTQPAVSAFQKAIRGDCTLLKDHISKEMNALNLIRCKCIPHNTPGADWQVLKEVVKKSGTPHVIIEGREHELVPWCLPNTSHKHNNWRGLYGRLDQQGHFPTSTTDPNPMGKVGQVFHPEQDRIISVRECARSQGFPDSFSFSGNINNKHRQVGNAVPPPLSHALGSQLYVKLEARRKARVQSRLAAQLD